jgi:hypothetical protein
MELVMKHAQTMESQEEIMPFGLSAYDPNNPDFSPEKDSPQARGCTTPISIFSNS